MNSKIYRYVTLLLIIFSSVKTHAQQGNRVVTLNFRLAALGDSVTQKTEIYDKEKASINNSDLSFRPIVIYRNLSAAGEGRKTYNTNASTIEMEVREKGITK